MGEKGAATQQRVRAAARELLEARNQRGVDAFGAELRDEFLKLRFQSI